VLIVHVHSHLANEVEVFDAMKKKNKNLFLYKLKDKIKLVLKLIDYFYLL
jgi:hypothetical protein